MNQSRSHAFSMTFRMRRLCCIFQGQSSRLYKLIGIGKGSSVGCCRAYGQLASHTKVSLNRNMFIRLFALVCMAVGGFSASLSGSDPIPIVAQSSDISPDGSFSNKWESANGISFQEEGFLKNAGQKDEAESVKGVASWTAPDGTKLSLGWKADENGAVFDGAHLPTPPPPQEIPVAIQRALDWIAAHPEKP